MRTFAFATQKGGSGKSTLAIGLAIAAAEDGERVAILETDPQGTIANWGLRRASPEPSIVRIAYAFQVERSQQTLAAEGYTLSIIDTAAGADRSLTSAAIRASDLCLVPTRPSVPDIEATHRVQYGYGLNYMIDKPHLAPTAGRNESGNGVSLSRSRSSSCHPLNGGIAKLPPKPQDEP